MVNAVVGAFTSANLWFVIGVVLILAEFAAPGVVLVFFGLGAVVVSIATYTGLVHSVGSQLLVFGISSLVLLFSLRRFVRNRFTGFVQNAQNPASGSVDDAEGTLVKVLEEITPEKPGRVEYKGAAWTAVADGVLPAGGYGRIAKIDGLTITVVSTRQEAP